MARSRNIKPGFFQNDELVELRYEWRLLFIGLWTIADREGRLEDRPKKIKMTLFPADNLDIEQGISELGAKGFVLRYEVENIKYIQIVNFLKHQKPHHQEAQSTIPEPPISGEGANQFVRSRPDSLNTDSLNTDSLSGSEKITDDKFEEFWNLYPKRAGGNPKPSAFKAWKARLKSGASADEIIEGVKRYSKFITATNRVGTEYVKQAATFLGPDEHFKESWTPPQSQDNNSSSLFPGAE